MRAKNKIISIISIVILSLIILNSNVYANEIETGEYSKKYLEWLELSDDEKEGTIPPLPFNIRGKSVTGIINKLRTRVKSISIPSSYDLREHIEVEVKNQMSTGQCWAFSANSSVETNLALNEKTYDFSERHIEYDTANNFLNGENEDALNRETGAGGYFSTAFTYYSRGSGPILEEYMPFENNEYSIDIVDLPKNVAIQKVDNMIYFPSIYKYIGANGELIYQDANENSYTDYEVQTIRNEIKEHIMQNGGVTTHIHAPNDWFYNEEHSSSNVSDPGAWPNHAVTIIGWDDNYSRENFNNTPTEDGAYIVLNSWGSEWGDNGVYYVSYEECLIEGSIAGVSNISDIEYDNLYQHDTSEVWDYVEVKYAANVFTSNNNETLKEVMVHCFSEQTCDIFVNSSNENLNINNLTKIASNVTLKPGYNTIEIEENIEFTKGNKFAIVVELTSDNYAGIGIETNNPTFGNMTSNSGESFASADGISWQDIYDQNFMMNFSIKAYTEIKEESINVSQIKGKGYEAVGGKYSFNLKTSYKENGKTVGITIYNGETNVTDQFNIIRNTVVGNGAYIKLETGDTIQEGEYSVEINLNNIETITKKFQVDEYNGNLRVSEFRDRNFYNYAKSIVSNAFTNDEDMRIIAEVEEFRDVLMINVPSSNITDITGIENFDAAALVYLSHNNITDISKLQEIEWICELQLEGNQIEDIEALSTLERVNYLDLSLNPITDFSPISGYNKLENLILVGCDISNLDFISELIKLENLDLTAALKEKIDISNIFNLTNLKTLKLNWNEWITEEELNELNKLKKLEEIELSGCEIETLNILKDLNNLNHIWITDGILRDASLLDSETFSNKNFGENLSLQFNQSSDTFYYNGDETIIVEIPVIFKQASNIDSKLYSHEGITLNNCEWNEYGKSIKINQNNCKYANMSINSGYASYTSYNVNIVDVNRIELISAPTKTEYKTNEELDLTGGVIRVYYQDETAEDIEITSDKIKVEGFNSISEGNKTITVKYLGYTATFNVNVMHNENVNVNIIVDLEYDNKKIETKKIDDIEYLSGFEFETKGIEVNSFISNINVSNNNENFEIKIYNNNKELKGDKLVGTGSKIKIYSDDEIIKEFTIVYYGDTDGNGIINAIDALAIIKNKSGKVPFKDEVYKEAGRITTNDGIPSAVDALAIVKHATGKYTINQSK